MVRFLAFGALWLLVFGTAIVGGWSVMFRLSYLLLFLFGAAWAWARLSARWLDVSREPVQPRAQVGSTLAEVISVYNLSWLPKPFVDVQARSSLPGHEGRFFTGLRGDGVQRWTLTTPCQQRGRYVLSPTIVTVGDPFGLFTRQVEFRSDSTVIVYPLTVDLPTFEAPDGDLAGGGRRRQRVPYTTAMATGIRDYQPGDPYNRIHWPNTARLGRLLVKEFEQDPAADVWVVLDLDRNVHLGSGPESTEEISVIIAGSLAKHFLLQNRAVGLLTQGHVLHPDRGTRQYLKILELLAVVRVREYLGVGELLLLNAPSLARGTSALIVTPTTRTQWLTAYEDLAHRGVRGAVVLLEARSFGSAHDSLPLVGALGALGVPTYMVKRGEPIEHALSRPYLADLTEVAV